MGGTPFWTATPLLYTFNDLEGHRARLIVAEKTAPIETRILYLKDDIPDCVREVNPDEIFPILLDKRLICHGYVLDELFHERFPFPSLLGVDPVTRAQQRCMSTKIREWYGDTDPQKICNHVAEIESLLTPRQQYVWDNEISDIDVTLAPFLRKHWDLVKAHVSERLTAYANRLFGREAFRTSLTPHKAAAFSVSLIVKEERWVQTTR